MDFAMIIPLSNYFEKELNVAILLPYLGRKSIYKIVMYTKSK